MTTHPRPSLRTAGSRADRHQTRVKDTGREQRHDVGCSGHRCRCELMGPPGDGWPAGVAAYRGERCRRTAVECRVEAHPAGTIDSRLIAGRYCQVYTAAGNRECSNVSRLAIQLFGRFAVWGESGVELRVPPGKVRALLAYLAERPGHAYSRAHLANLFWGNRSDAAARHSLSQALTTLRRSLGTVVGPMASDPEMLVLDAARVDVDVADFRRLAEQDSEAALTRAVRLYAEPLPDLNVAQPDFQDWLATRRGELQGLATDVYQYLITQVLSDGDQNRAAELARALLEIDPASEFGHRVLIARYLSQGHTVRALQQYRICRRRLRDEVGVAPSGETEKLVQRLYDIGTGPPPARNPGVLIAPVVTGGGIDPNVLQGMVADVAEELTRLRSVEAIVGTVSVSADPGCAVAELGAEHSLPYSLAVGLRGLREKIHVSATLVRTEDAAVIWQSTYEFALAQIFNPGVIAAPVRHYIERDWLEAAKHVPEQEWSAYTHFLRGTELYFEQWNASENWRLALPYFEKALTLGVALTQAQTRRDSLYAHPDIWPGRDDISERTAAFIDAAHHALEVDPAEPNVHRMLSMTYLHRRQFKAAHHQFSHGLRENPNDANLNIAFARYLTHIGEPERALAVARRAQSLNPVHPDYYWEQLGLTLHALERHKDALAALQHVRRPSYYEYLYMASSQVALEQHPTAARSLERALEEQPELRASRMNRLLPYLAGNIGSRLLKRLMGAGLPR